MLSENAIENLVRPIVERQQRINEYVIKTICDRIKEIGSLNSNDIYKLQQIFKMGADVQKINAEIARQTGLQVNDIKRIIRTVAMDNYVDARPFYDYRMRPYIPFSENIILQRRVQAMANKTANDYINLSKSQGFMIRDLKNPQRLIPTTISQTYQSIIDEAVQASQSGVIDYNTAMRRSIKQLADSGLRYITYNTPSGRIYTQRMDSAVRRNILDGIRDINQEMQRLVGEEFGADGVEISVHENPATDHAEMQGHIYSNVEFQKMQSGQTFKDIQGRNYHSFERAVGTLNCRHFAISVVIETAKQTYSDKELKQILDRNDKGYTLPNGKHLTMYECTQYQRNMETKIRAAKDGQIAARASGDDFLAKQYQAKVNKWQKEYRAFSNACGLTVKRDRTSVSGYQKISVK